MPFDVLKTTDNNEAGKTLPVGNTPETPKYTNPEIEAFHKSIIKDYPQSNEKNLQTIIEALNKDIGDNFSTQRFETIKDLFKNDPNFLSGEKTENDIKRIIKILISSPKCNKLL